MSEEPKSKKIREVDEALRAWSQGDCILGECWFVHRFNPQHPLTGEAETLVAEDGAAGLDLVESAVRGLMIASQTCDIARTCAKRPFVEVCPLVELDAEMLQEVERARRPRYVYLPGVAQHGLAADLDRIMTIEKSLISGWERTPGCDDGPARRRLALALARKRGRFAFPDDFVHIARNLQNRLRRKHDKDSEEGRALRALLEIRVRAAPSWNADQVEITFWFIRDDDTETFEGKRWDSYLDGWLGLVEREGRFRKVDGSIVTLDDLTARDYVESDPLDLDHLSTRDR